MRKQAIRVVVAVMAVIGVAYAVSAQSADPWVGVWKLNVATSKYSPGPPPNKSETQKFELSAGGFVKHTLDAVTVQGQSTHVEVVAKFDGKDYPAQGGQANITLAYRRIDDRTLELTVKTDGKVTATARNVISRDGKTRTSTQTGKNPQGQVINNTVVFDKQ